MGYGDRVSLRAELDWSNGLLKLKFQLESRFLLALTEAWMRSLSTSVPTVVAALLLGGLGVIGTSETQVSTPGEIGLSMDQNLLGLNVEG